MLFTVDKYGKPGHPTRRFDMVRKLRKRGQIRIVGGGATGKPPVVMFLNKKFDYTQTAERKFLICLDPGYHYIGFAVCEIRNGKLVVYCRGVFHARIAEIKGLMTDRKSYRRQRRYISRYKKRRLSALQRRVLTKFKAPRNHRTKNQSNATLKHGVETHLNLYHKLLKLFSLPRSQTQFIMEDNVFDIRAMTWGKTSGAGYQVSPRTQVEVKKCFVCSIEDGLQEHHLVQKKRGGTEVKENKIYLCKSCHKDVHAGRIYLPIKGIKQWRELGTMNAIIGTLRNVSWLNFVPVSNMVLNRRKLGLTKNHANDALAAAVAFSNCMEIDNTNEQYLTLVKFRRHNRARIHAQRDRLYKIGRTIIARNRQKRTDQKEDSFADVILSPEEQRKLKVYPGTKILKPFRSDMPTIGGDVWLHNPTGSRFVATSVTSKKYIYSPVLKEIIGRSYIHPGQCRRVIRNEGVVVWN